MKWIRRHRAIVLLIASSVLFAGIFLGRMALQPSALAFAGGQRVDLSQYQGRSPVGVPVELAHADPIAKGKYLTEAADCMACHTAKGGNPFAGGRAFKLPFGTLYTPNITPDRETGIGAWSDGEFLRAVHDGISRDGSRLYPAFPYASYAMLTDTDVIAIRRYLETLEPVRQKNLPNSFSFPFNQRWLMAAWSAFFNREGRFRPVVERSEEWNRGAYLVEAAAHCGECHTPRNLMQAMNMRQKFSGGVAESWNAYNITSDRISGIGDWPREALASYLSRGHAQNHGVASGPMAEAVELSLSKLTQSDIRAMVTYLRSIPAIRTSAAPAMAGPAQAIPGETLAGEAHGKRLFEGACASCHAWSGQGALVNGAQLTGNRAVNDRTSANVVLMILEGTGKPATGRAYMPSFRTAYSDAEIADLANYVTARFGASPARVTPKDVARMRAE